MSITSTAPTRSEHTVRVPAGRATDPRTVPTSSDPSDAPLIAVSGLTKRYGDRAVVEDLSFTCPPGTVTGFLGPNGAGKSTTLRILTGLVRGDAGSATVGGRRFTDIPSPARTVGVMLDAADLHRGRTGRDTLRLTATACGMPASRADEVLEQVGLSDAGRKRVGSYSYGMRQRLGIGVALIGDPEVLILDEPANGLDPEGIRWMRALLRGFADAGGAVLLSSHQLREVEATVDRLVVIDHGRLVHEGTLDELVTPAGTEVACADLPRLREALEREGVAVESTAAGRLVVALSPADLGQLALREQIALTHLADRSRGELEDIFFQLTAH